MSSNVSSKQKEKDWTSKVDKLRDWCATCEDFDYLSSDTMDKILKMIAEAKQDGRKEAIEILNTYKCSFNWDFEKGKPKHKSYILLSEVLSQLEGEKLTNA